MISRRSEAVPKILYVLGRGRSGSTIFANVIGSHDGFFSSGELRYLWDPVVQNDAQCACGERVSTCEVWSKVLERVGEVSADIAGRWQRDVVRERNLIRILRYKRGGDWPELESFSDLMSKVYSAIREVTGASVIVDSSKRPSYAAAVRLMPEIDFYCIHVVRDPRASAYSWGTRRHSSVFGGGTEVQRRSALDSTVRWDVLNLEAELLMRRLPDSRRLRLRYEDFVDDPRQVTAQVASFVGQSRATSPFVDDETVVLKPNHTIAGNPSRMATGKLVIRDKAEWHSAQRGVDKGVATALALPFLHRYGYALRPRLR